MAINEAAEQRAPRVTEARSARVASQGLADHDLVATLCEASGAEASRDFADAVHMLCALYGRHPGLVELALPGCPAGEVREWLRGASDAFERERLYLVRLTSAVGPIPSTPGSAETQSTLSAQRHAIETLALSERRGCALGATTALVTDWGAVRTVLARAARGRGSKFRSVRCRTARRSVRWSQRRPSNPRPSAGTASAPNNYCSRTAACSTFSKPAPRRAPQAELAERRLAQ